METIKIKYHNNDLIKLENIGGEDLSNWIDLRVAEDIFIPEGEFRMVSLGVSMQLPEGYEAHIVPRSSTFKRYGLIQTNHQAVIDSSYCGDEDIWKYPVYCINGVDKYTVNCIEYNGTFLKVNDRICQFRIVKRQPSIKFEEVETLNNENRGGFGSTSEDKGKNVYVENKDKGTKLSKDLEQYWVFTFSKGHENEGHYIVIYGTFDKSRKKMSNLYGNVWDCQYSKIEWDRLASNGDVSATNLYPYHVLFV